MNAVLTFENVYDESFINIFSSIMTVIGFTAVLILFCMILIIYFKTPSSMKTVKIYLLLYTIFGFYFELIIILYKPIGISSISTIYPIGLLSPMDSKISQLLMTFMISSLLGMILWFILMLIDRFFAMSNYTSKNLKFYRNPIFYNVILFLNYIIDILLCIYVVYFSPFFRSPEDTAEYIRMTVLDGERLLNIQPKLLSSDWTTMTPLIVAFGATISYLIPFFIFFALCVYKLKTSLHKFNSYMKKVHVMLFKCIVFQCLSILATVGLPVIVEILAIIYKLPEAFVLIPYAFIWSFPIIDCFVTIIIIRPYREFVLNIFRKVSLIRKSEISTVQTILHSNIHRY